MTLPEGFVGRGISGEKELPETAVQEPLIKAVSRTGTGGVIRGGDG